MEFEEADYVEKAIDNPDSPADLINRDLDYQSQSTAISSKFNTELDCGPAISTEELPEAQNNSNLFLTCLLTSGTYHFGYYNGIFNPLGEPLLKHVYNITDKSQLATLEGNLNMYFTMGGLLAVIFSGKIADKIGRIKLLTYLELLSLVTYSLYSMKNLNILLTARFISGIISSTNAAIGLVAIKEMMPEKKISFGGLFLYLCLTSFILIAWFTNPIYGSNKETLASHWKWLLTWPVLISIPRLIFLLMSFKFCGIDSP